MNDQNAERAILATCYQSGLTDMLMRLDPEDFVDPLHVLLLCELKNMVAANEPFDPVATARWFKLKRVMDRAKVAKIKEDVAHLAADVLTSFAAPASVVYYFKVLRTERLRRAICRLSVGLQEKNMDEPRHPMKVLRWAKENIDLLMDKGVDANSDIEKM